MKTLVLSFSVFSIFLAAEIIETKNFHEITNYIESETLVLLDIDDTLLLPTQTLGTDAWFVYRLNHYLQIEKEYPLALDKALAEWEAVRHLTKVTLVEEGTDEVIQKMQKSGVTVMGLTTQGLALATRTISQLKSLNINLLETCPSKEDHYFINGHGVLYRNGVLFTSGSLKGAALLKLFDLIDYHPKHILFINDKENNLQDVERSAIANGIRFTGLRYSFGDKRIEGFREEIAEIQWRHSTFDHLLSDEEAESLLAN